MEKTLISVMTFLSPTTLASIATDLAAAKHDRMFVKSIRDEKGIAEVEELANTIVENCFDIERSNSGAMGFIGLIMK